MKAIISSLFLKQPLRLLVVCSNYRSEMSTYNRGGRKILTDLFSAAEHNFATGLFPHKLHQDVHNVDVVCFMGCNQIYKTAITGLVKKETLMDYADYLVTKPQETIQSAEIIRTFHEKQLSLIPYAEAIDITGEGSLDLIEAEEIRTSPVKTSLPDANWVSLQNICGG